MPDPSRLHADDDLYAHAMAAHQAGRHQDAVRLLWQASQQGHVAAMSLLGAQLLSGRGAAPDPPAGMRLIQQAAEGGGDYACALAATIAASGVQGPADWPHALDFLQRSAELGYAVAQAQLRLLAGPRGAAGGAWAELRRSVDLAAWRAPPEAQVILEDPSIRMARGFASVPVCDWIISRARDRLAPAQLFDTAALRPVIKDTRSNSAAPFDLVYLDLVILLLRERLAAAVGVAMPALEAPQVFHYAVGQTFAPHYDFLEPDVPGHAASIAQSGQRVATLLVYLNEAYEGGETDFPLLGARWRGRTGDALMFANTDAGGEPDRRMFHAGLPPTSGEKWLFSQWVRGAPGAQWGRVESPDR